MSNVKKACNSFRDIPKKHKYKVSLTSQEKFHFKMKTHKTKSMRVSQSPRAAVKTNAAVFTKDSH